VNSTAVTHNFLASTIRQLANRVDAKITSPGVSFGTVRRLHSHPAISVYCNVEDAPRDALAAVTRIDRIQHSRTTSLGLVRFTEFDQIGTKTRCACICQIVRVDSLRHHRFSGARHGKLDHRTHRVTPLTHSTLTQVDHCLCYSILGLDDLGVSLEVPLCDDHLH